jgi:hypothetical protein
MVHSGDNHVILHGEIVYTDAFKKLRRTKYRYKLAIQQGAGLFSVCETGNEAT